MRRRRASLTTRDIRHPASKAKRSSAAGPLSAAVVTRSRDVARAIAAIRLLPSQRLETVRELAVGGMGAVDVVLDRALGRQVARKTISQGLDSVHFREMFVREARILGLLEHPNIVPVYDLGEDDAGRLYFTMRLVQGRSLREVLRAGPPAPRDIVTLLDLLDVIVKLCDALAFAHSRGVLHCDLKPANIMVGDFGQVFLMDWGVARLIGARSVRVRGAGRPGTSPTDFMAIGTPAYMSPEQARGQRSRLDERSDVFQVGALVYEILTGRRPYRGTRRQQTLVRASQGRFRPPSAVLGGAGKVPAELERIVLKAMALRPSDRYSTALELKGDLVRFMRGGESFPRVFFRKGSALMRQGEPGDAAYILVSGRCEITKDVGRREKRVVRVIWPGEVVGEMAILTGGPRTATVVASEDTVALRLEVATLERELSMMKPWVARLLKTIAARFRDLDALKHAALSSAGAPEASRLARQVWLTLTAVGKRRRDGSLEASWSAASRSMSEQLGGPPLEIWSVTAVHPEIRVFLEEDRIVVSDPRRLAERLGL
jgi:eukaryotic-like serine/threonine-protein kinase